MPAEKALVYEKLFGSVKVEIFSFRGANGDFLKAKIARIYTDKEGKWKDTSFYGARDLENVALATAEANNFMLQNAPATLEPTDAAA